MQKNLDSLNRTKNSKKKKKQQQQIGKQYHNTICYIHFGKNGILLNTN